MYIHLFTIYLTFDLTDILLLQGGQVCCRYRSHCVGDEYWPASPTLLPGASRVGNAPSVVMGDANVLYSTPSSVFHSSLAVTSKVATSDVTAPSKKAVWELVKIHQHQPSSTRTPSPTRPAPHSHAALVVASNKPVGRAPLPHDVPQTFAPLGKTSDSDIAKTHVVPSTWHHRLIYRNPISWIRSRKAQLFRERRERQRNSEP